MTQLSEDNNGKKTSDDEKLRNLIYQTTANVYGENVLGSLQNDPKVGEEGAVMQRAVIREVELAQPGQSSSSSPYTEKPFAAAESSTRPFEGTLSTRVSQRECGNSAISDGQVDMSSLSQGRKEHPLYTTSNNIWGSELSSDNDELAFEGTERRGRPNTFSKKWGGTKYRDTSLNTSINKSRVHNYIE